MREGLNAGSQLDGPPTCILGRPITGRALVAAASRPKSVSAGCPWGLNFYLQISHSRPSNCSTSTDADLTAAAGGRSASIW